jgi:hypothetical protein
MIYIAITLIAIWAVVLLLKIYSKANPATIKKIYKTLILVAGIYFVFVLVKVGLPYVAAAVGGVIALAPFFGRFVQLLYTFRILKGVFKEVKPDKNKHKSNDNISMTKKKACEILGVDENASKKEIEDAYKHHMKKNHPDTGGSKYFATELNKAKDVLLKEKKRK